MKGAIGMTFLRRLRRFRGGESGIAAMEFALATPMLVLLMTGGFDFGRAMYEQSRISSAARAGVQYAAQSSSAWTDTNNIIAAVRNDASDTTSSLTVTTGKCTCPTGSPLCSTTTTCTGSTTTGTYVQVTVAESVGTLVNYPFLTSPINLTSQSLIRIQ
jgi:Flp pilus assembly protein TadG